MARRWAATAAATRALLLLCAVAACGAHYDIFYPEQLHAAAKERAIDKQVILYTFSNELTGYRDMWVHSACPGGCAGAQSAAPAAGAPLDATPTLTGARSDQGAGV